MKFYGIRIFYIISTVFVALSGFGQILETNSIGFVSLKMIQNDSVFLNAYFHPSNLDSLPADIDNEPDLLSVEGKRIYDLNKKLRIGLDNQVLLDTYSDNFNIVFWCESDGRSTLMCEIPLSVPIDGYKGVKEPQSAVENIIGFAVIDYEPDSMPEFDYADDEKPLLSVDFNDDGEIDAVIHGRPDEAIGGFCLEMGFAKRIKLNIDCCGP